MKTILLAAAAGTLGACVGVALMVVWVLPGGLPEGPREAIAPHAAELRPGPTRAGWQLTPQQRAVRQQIDEQARAEYLAQLSPEERRDIEVYEHGRRSVVNIRTLAGAIDTWFAAVPAEGAGSGWVFDRRGHIVTNYHVVEGSRSIEVTLFNGETAEASFVGADPPNDIAVLRIDVPQQWLHPLEFGDSAKLMVGQRIYAIGNPFGLEGSMTMGIISSLNRTLRSPARRLIQSVIQIDAALNRGNSGGPLLDSRGKLVGMNTAIASRVGESTGVGFAIPSNTMARVVPQIIDAGRVERASLGIATALAREGGLLIMMTIPDGAADRAGLRGVRVERQRLPGGLVFEQVNAQAADRIVAIDGRPVESADDLFAILDAYQPGDQVTVTIVREGRRLDVPVVLDIE